VTIRNRQRQTGWRSAVFELLLIFVAILAALATDAWWDYRQDRRAEAEYLEALRGDFEQNRNRLATLIENANGIVALGDELLVRLREGTDEDDLAKLYEQLRPFYTIALFTPVTSTYDEMIASGRLLLLRDGDLRLALARYHQQLDTVHEAEQLLLGSWRDAQLPFLRRNAVLTRIRPEDAGQPPAPFQENVAALQSLEFWNLVAEWRSGASDLVEIYGFMQQEGDGLIDRISDASDQ